SKALRDAMRAVRARFCLTDIEVGFTMLDRARATRDPSVRRRTWAIAQSAHDTVVRMLRSEDIPQSRRALIGERLKALALRLEREVGGRASRAPRAQPRSRRSPPSPPPIRRPATAQRSRNRKASPRSSEHK